MRLKILLVMESDGGGVARHVIDLALGLVRAGHEVHLAYSPVRPTELLTRGLKALTSEGVTTTPLPMRRSPHPEDALRALALRKYIREHGPFDVVHGHSSKGGAIGRLAGSGQPGVRVYTPHALYTMNPELGALPRLVFTGVERALDLLSHGLIMVSDDEHRHALDLGLSAHKLFVVYNGIDVEAPSSPTDLRAELGIGPEDLCVGCVARFAPQKAPEVLVDAFDALASRIPRAHLIMVGDGPLESAIREQAAGAEARERIHFPGPLDGPTAMAAFDVFALPSRYESLPYVLLEAMAAGLPIVMTRVGGAGTVVVHGLNGLVVPPEDPAALAEALESVLTDNGLRLELSRAATTRVAEFSKDVMIQKTLAVYGELLGRTNPA